MQITNKYHLTQATVNAIKHDDYDKGESYYTVTELIKPPQMCQLQTDHKDDIVEDASDRIWVLFGNCIHHILEKATKNEIVEKRYYTTIMGMKIGGKFDNLDCVSGTLTDYKVTSVWSYIYGKDEWDQQLNMLRFILENNGISVKKLQVQGIWRDWTHSQAQRKSDYPPAPSSIVDIPIWEDNKTKTFIENRILAHIGQQQSPSKCSDKETWYKGTKWAVMKKDRKSAVRVLDSQKEAFEWMQSHPSNAKPQYVEYRAGIYKRCERYCNVSLFCAQNLSR